MKHTRRILLFGTAISAILVLSARVLIQGYADHEDETDHRLSYLLEVDNSHTDSIHYRDGSEPKLPSQDWHQLLGPKMNSTTIEPLVDGLGHDSVLVEAWRSAAGTGYSAPIARDDDVVLFHRIGDRVCIDCLSLRSGKSKWRFEKPTTYRCRFEYSSGPYSTPVIDEEFVYAWCAEGDLVCVSRKTGELVWERALYTDYEGTVEYFPVATSPLLLEGKLILNVGGSKPNSGIIALDKETGQTIWQSTNERASYATPVAGKMHDRQVVFVLGYDHLLALNPLNGKVHWQIEFHGKNRELGKLNACSPLVMGNQVLVSAMGVGAMSVSHLSNDTPQVLWRTNARGVSNQYVNLVPNGDGVFGFTTRSRSLTYFDAKSGAPLGDWDCILGREPHIIGLNDSLLILSEDGILARAILVHGKPMVHYLSEDPFLDGPCLTSPVATKGRILLRNERTLLCLRSEMRVVDSNGRIERSTSDSAPRELD
jgi:outer membrane protein assembly factor BamB